MARAPVVARAAAQEAEESVVVESVPVVESAVVESAVVEPVAVESVVVESVVAESVVAESVVVASVVVAAAEAAVRRFRRRERWLRRACWRGDIPSERYWQSVESWASHAAHADAWRLLSTMGLQDLRQ